MSSFYYFLPDQTLESVVKKHQVRTKILERYGLAVQFQTARMVPHEVLATEGPGPDGEGVILYPHTVPTYESDPHVFGFSPNVQQWLKCDKLWIGWLEEDVPTPRDLQHTEQTPLGYDIEDASGHRWAVPIIRSPQSNRQNCSRTLIFNDEMKLVEKVSDDDTPLWEMAGRCVELIDGSADIPLEELAMMTIAFLQKHYRIGPYEIAAFTHAGNALLRDQWVYQVIGAVVDLPMREEYAKKNGSASRTKKTPTTIPSPKPTVAG